jgi:hypothetical protein
MKIKIISTSVSSHPRYHRAVGQTLLVERGKCSFDDCFVDEDCRHWRREDGDVFEVIEE